ncbi:uncharacterized protein LOC143028267 [Oratosquilla oratoria]|uniref:uncharacterized protein LOC143028267 n=1 Tax=Oratosquilla oratoria TaxID=337810 RepID=UPI003F77285C
MVAFSPPAVQEQRKKQNGHQRPYKLNYSNFSEGKVQAPMVAKIDEKTQPLDPTRKKVDSLKMKSRDQHHVRKSPQLILKTYALEEKVVDQIRRHTLVHLALPEESSIEGSGLQFDVEDNESSFNLLMADVSSSMRSVWPHVVEGWNTHIAPHLKGLTHICVFSNNVSFLRTDRFLKETDFIGGATNLCKAFSSIAYKVKAHTERKIRVYLITDGCDTFGSSPREDLAKMTLPEGKHCEVYVWAIGTAFPVKYSVELRSRLHNGRANIPTLFWSRDRKNVTEEAENMETYLKKTNDPVRLSHPGSLLPGLPKTHNFYPGEWIYMERDPDTLGCLQVSTNNGTLINCRSERHQFTMALMLDFLVPQWNSQMVQMQYVKGSIQNDIFPLMERLFQFLSDQVPMPPMTASASLQGRFLRKEMKEPLLRFRTLMNQTKTLLTRGKFMDEMAIAESILMTTVTTRKHFTKGLRIKGHTEEDYVKDCADFMEVYVQVKESLRDLSVTPEDCCRITLSSTISDLKDEQFPELMKLNKFEFLKTFSISGIPVFSRSRNSTELNPWSYKVDSILTSPFGILSQVALEEFANANSNVMSQKDKEVRLQHDLDNSTYNAIVPVFPAAATKTVKSLVRTKLYAMCVTFSLLKNPHIVDYNIHLAALAAVWIKTLSDYPVASERPDFVKERLESIEVTATLYMDRPGLTLYMEELLARPHCALMAENTKGDPQVRPLKCESLLKPFFLLHMILRTGRPVDHQVKFNIVKLATAEFVGRCLNHIAHTSIPFISCFMPELTEKEKKKEWLSKRFRSFSESLLASEGNILGKFYFPEQIKKYVVMLLREKREVMKQAVGDALNLSTSRVRELSNINSCGDVTWKSLQICAIELGLPKAEVKELFSEKNALIYISHALTYPSSRLRMSAPIGDYPTCLEKIKTQLVEELTGCAKQMLQEELCQAFQRQWYQEYDEHHGPHILIRPMTRMQLVEEARAKGIEVTAENFERVYLRYNKKMGLLRNACQSSGCPYYLQPHRTFSQHLVAERRPGLFLRQLHYVATGKEDFSTKADLLNALNCDPVTAHPNLYQTYLENMENLSLLYRKFTLMSNYER